MIEKAVVQELYRHNQWANARAFDALSTLSREDFAREPGREHASIRATLTHIVWAEWLYLRRWQGTSPQTVFQASEFAGQADLKARWAEVQLEQQAFVESLTAERLLSRVRYVNLQGESWEYPLWRQMYHVVSHSGYHRGQLAMLLRQLGARPLPTDFLLFHDQIEAGVPETSPARTR
jgi:uncharacterized damage-inducible protein DinB